MTDAIGAVNGSKNTAKTAASKKTDKTTKTQNIDMTGATGSTTSTGKGTNVASGQFTQKTKDLVDNFYNAVYGIGTDEENMKAALDQINKDNIIDVMRCWNKYHSNEAGESFMEAFMWDAGHADKKNYGRQIAAMLRDKADELGIYDQCKDDFSKIDKEMRAIFYVSNDVSANYDNIIENIAMKEGKDYGTPHKK